MSRPHPDEDIYGRANKYHNHFAGPACRGPLRLVGQGWAGPDRTILIPLYQCKDCAALLFITREDFGKKLDAVGPVRIVAEARPVPTGRGA